MTPTDDMDYLASRSSSFLLEISSTSDDSPEKNKPHWAFLICWALSLGLLVTSGFFRDPPFLKCFNSRSVISTGADFLIPQMSNPPTSK